MRVVPPIALLVLLNCIDAVPNVSSKYPLALKALFGLSLRLQVFLEDQPKQNFMVSPLSATVLGAQLMLGTSGKLRRHIASTLLDEDVDKYANFLIANYSSRGNTTFNLPYGKLHLEIASLLTDLESKRFQSRLYKLNQKSALFYNQQLQLKDRFADYLRRFYSVSLFPLDFGAKGIDSAKFINQWVSNNTNGMIKRIIDIDAMPLAGAIFANAVYFSAKWAMPFDPEVNRNGAFRTTAETSVKVEYMLQSFDEIAYAETDTYQMIRLPYENNELSMIILLPLENSKYAFDIARFVHQLDPMTHLKVLEAATKRGVVVKMPKMRLTHSFSILETLKKFYIFRQKLRNKNNKFTTIKNKIDMFENFTFSQKDLQHHLYLTDAVEQQNLPIDDIVQQVVLNVNEYGTEIGVATSSVIDLIGGQKNFIMDRPFVFYILDEYTQATLFWGTIVNPAAQD